MQFFPWLPPDELDVLSEPLAGGIRLRYVPADPLSEGDLGTANLSAAVQYMRNFRASPGGMMVRLYSNPPPGNNSGNAVASGYTRGGQASAHVRSMPVNQPLPHPAACQCVACMPVQPSGAVPGCSCPMCAARVSRGQSPFPPPSYTPPARPKPKASWGARGMDGFDGAPLVAGTALGYRWWTLRAPQLHQNPGDAGKDWEPGLLRGVKDFWQPGVNQARCLPAMSVPHPFELVPDENCACGFWAYWEIQQHDMGVVGSLPVVGVVRASGQVIMGPRGFRAQKAEIVALHLPFRIEPDLPSPREPMAGRSRISPPRPQRRFTGRVISFPGAPPVPPSLGGPSQPAPLPPLRPPPEPEPPTDEEIRAAADRAEAWMAVIADRLAVMYPGAEVCATLGLMKAKYPVKSEYAPPQEQAQVIPCPYCGAPCTADEIHMHVVSNHYF